MTNWEVHDRALCRLACAVLLLLPIAGCGGSDTAKITGRLFREDGTPLAGALVIARCEETGQSARGETDQEGHFVLHEENSAGMSPGEYYVIIMEARQTLDNAQPRSIAVKYRSPARSGLSLTVESGEDKELDWTLDAP